MIRRTAGGLLVLLALPAFADPDAAKPGVESLVADVDAGRVLVSFRVSGALDEETLERIHSGIPVRFRHKIDVVSKRGFPLLPAKVEARTIVVTRVEYDSLTQRYRLQRTIETRSRLRKLTPPPTAEEATTDSLATMRTWMTRMRDVPVYDPAWPLPAGKLRVKVETSLGRRYALLIFPATLGASGECEVEVPE